MNTLLARSQLRFALRHPVGTLTSLVGVTVAVTAVVAVHLVGQSLRIGLETAANPAIGGYTHVVTRAGLREADYFRLRERWRRGEPALTNVQAMVPLVDDYVMVGRGSANQEPFRLIGFEPLAGGEGRGAIPGWTTGQRVDGAATRFLVDDVVIASGRAVQGIHAAGDEIDGHPVTVMEAEGGDALLADLPSAQRLLNRESELDAIWIRVASARSRWLTWLDALLPGIAAALPSDAAPALEGYDVVAERRWNPFGRFADASVFNLGMLAMLSVLMAAFLATQASFSNAARRRDERRRLLALGVSNARLRALAAAEGLLLGSAGAVFGIALGVAVAKALLHVTNATEALGLPATALDAWVVGKALFCGSAVASIGPLFATRDRPSHPRIGVAAAVVAVALTMLGLAHGDGNGSLPSVFAALLAACGVQILGVVPLAAFVVQRAATRYGFGSLATRSSLRGAAARVGEIRLALGALSVASAAAIGMGLMVESLRRDFLSMLEQRLWNGVYVSAEAGTDVHLDVEWMRQLPGAKEVRRYGEFDARLAQGRVRVDVAVLDASETARYGFAGGALDKRAMLNEVGARLLGVDVGETVTVRAGGASVDVEVAHVFRDFGAVQSRLLMPAPLQAPFGERVAWRQIWVLAEDRDTARLSAALRHRYRTSRVTDQTQIRDAAMMIFDRSFVVSRALTVVALAIAAVGLYAALTALLSAREREFRLWSVIGYSRGEIWRQAMAQTSFLGVVAVAAAVPFGVFIAWVLCAYVNPLAFGWSIDLRLQAGAIGYPLLLGLGVTLLAGAVPAYRSAATTNHGD